MPRNRMVRCDYWVNEQVLSCSLNARLLFIGLWNFCDDYGIHPASHITLKAEVFPVDNITIEEIKKLINELINNRLIDEYAVDGTTYWMVTGWKNIQKIDKPTYRYPLPLTEVKATQLPRNTRLLDDNSQNSHRTLEYDSTSTHSILPNSRVILDANEKEVKEKGKELHICEASTSPVNVFDPVSSASRQVFEHWQSIMNHTGAKFDRKREQVINNALSLGYSVDDLKQAIDGCKRTPHNMGKNDRGQVYDAVSLILRGADHIERFMSNANNYDTKHGLNTTDDLMSGVI